MSFDSKAEARVLQCYTTFVESAINALLARNESQALEQVVEDLHHLVLTRDAVEVFVDNVREALFSHDCEHEGTISTSEWRLMTHVNATLEELSTLVAYQ